MLTFPYCIVSKSFTDSDEKLPKLSTLHDCKHLGENIQKLPGFRISCAEKIFTGKINCSIVICCNLQFNTNESSHNSTLKGTTGEIYLSQNDERPGYKGGTLVFL